MLICPACRKEVPKGSIACPACGTPLPASALELTSSYLGAPTSLDSTEMTPGMVLGGRYRLVAALGLGGMGDVYRADDLILGHPVALKFLPYSLRNDPDRLARFHKEVRIARQVSHPMVCRVYDIAEADGRLFLTMEYVDGEDLASLLRRIGRLPEDKGIEIALQLCAGVAAAHDKDVLHRDLKPRNIMIDGRGCVRITDFGLAAFADAIPEADIRSGTPMYMAPEQLAGKAVSVKSDLYSLGLILYEIFTGAPVFKATSREELSRLHETQTPAKLSSVVSSINSAIERIVLQCLEKDPSDRPASALAVAAALPGGGALGVALAEGRTPSPQMVADAGEKGSLHPLWASLLLATSIAGIIVVALLANRTALYRLVPLERSPQSLAAKAQSVIDRFGYPGPPADTRFNFSYDESYLHYVADTDSRLDRWAALANGEPAAMYFWYRQSPEYLIPTGMGLRVYPGRVTPHDPPLTVAGMTNVMLDTRGFLLEFVYVPERANQRLPAGAVETDWKPAFEEAGIDLAKAKPVTPAWLPPVYSDRRAAWQVPPATPDGEPRFVEAASYQGKVVYFRLRDGPWVKPDTTHGFLFNQSRLFEYVYAALSALLLLGAAWLARRNLKLRRVDQTGSFRLAAGLFLAHLVCMILAVVAEDRVPVFGAAVTWLMKALGFAAFWAGIRWLMYVALEPYVRRRWPWRLTSWTRLLSGRFRDPLVGRDILIGAVLGVGLAILVQLHIVLPRLVGQAPPIPLLIFPASLTNVPFYLLMEAPVAVEDSLQWFFLLFLLVFFVRRDSVAAVLVSAVALVYYFIQEQPPLLVNAALTAITVAVSTFVLMRFGLLAQAVGLFFCYVLYQTPVTLDFRAWYGQAAMIYMLALAAMILYGFIVSLGGRPLFRDVFFKDA
jgi:Protein kinase domain